MIENKCRRLRPITTVQQIPAGVGGFLPNPPLGKRHFPPPILEKGLGRTLWEPTSVLGIGGLLPAPPLGKRHFPPPIRNTGLGSTLCEPTPVLGIGGLLPAPPLGKRHFPPPIRKTGLGSTLCEPTPVLGVGGLLPAPPLGKRHFPPPIRKTGLGSTLCEPTPVLGVGGFLPTPPLGKRHFPPPVLEKGLGRTLYEPTPVLRAPPTKRNPIRTSKVVSLPPLQPPPRVGVPQHEKRSFLQYKWEYENRSFLQKVQCWKMAIQDDDNALSPINKRFLELENEIKNLAKYSSIVERYQSRIPYEISRAYEDLNPVDEQRLRKHESDITAEHLKQVSRDITRNIEELERVKVKRNLLLDKREKHKKSLKQIDERRRLAQEAQKAVLKRIRDSGVNRNLSTSGHRYLDQKEVG